jgi:hypothetical protein
MGFFDTSRISKTEKEYFQILTSIYAYELTKGPLSQAFMLLPEKALTEFILKNKQKGNGIIWDDGYAHDPYLVGHSLYVAAKKTKHPEPRRLVDEFIAICLSDLSYQIDSLVRNVRDRYQIVLESLGIEETLNHEHYTAILHKYLKTELIASTMKPAPYYALETSPSYFKFNPLIQIDNRHNHKWKWQLWNNIQIPREVELLERLCNEGSSMGRQLKIILNFNEPDNSLFDINEGD